MRRLLSQVGYWTLVSVLGIYLLFPLYYAILTSLKSGPDVFRVDYWPRAFDLSNYVRVFAEQPFARNIANSVLVSSGAVVVAIALGLAASFALGRVRFRGRASLLLLILAISMFPQVAVLSGMFELIRALGLYGGLSGLVLSYTIFTLPFTVWVLTAFIRDLPVEIEEAGIMDGATPRVLLVRIFLPLMWPAMVSTGLLAFIVAWNEFLFALTFTLSNQQRTVPVAIALMSGGSEFELPWGNIMAGSVIVTLPLILLVFLFQRRLVSGMTAGAVKG